MTTPTRYATRSDSLPEFHDYQDTGCSVAPSCLACHLKRCIYEPDGGIAQYRRFLRIDEARRLRSQGHSPRRIAALLNISPRTYFRLLISTDRPVSGEA